MPDEQGDAKKGKASVIAGVRAIWRHIRPHKRALATLSVLGILSAITNGFVPLLVGRFFDGLVHPSSVAVPYLGTVSLFAVLLAAWVAVQVAANAIDWVMGKMNRVLGTDLQAHVIVDAYSHILTLPVSFFKDKKSGELSHLISRTSWMTDTIVSGILVGLAPQFLTIIVGISIAFWLKPLLAWVLITGVSLYVITIVRLIRPVGDLQFKSNKLWNEAYGNVHDAYSNLQTVKAAGSEAYERTRAFDGFFGPKGAASVWNQIEILWNNISASQRILVVGTQLAVFIFSISFVLAGTMTIGDLIAFNSYAALVFGPFVQLGTQWQSLQNGLTAAAEVEEIFQTAPEAYERKDAPSLSGLRGDVRFEDVHFSYGEGKPEVLKGLSFAAKAGEIIALVGETGSGKSTTSELISGYYYPTSGTVSIDGHDLKDLSLRELRAHIAIVPQEVVLFNSSIIDNIRYGRPDASDEEVRAAAKKAYAHIFIEKFPEGYAQTVGERGIKLSVGQKQRIAIARAILRDPRILILDEPTSALDAETEKYITGSLEKLMKGRTTFIIAHRLSTVRKADRILVLKEGKIAEQGTHDELVAIPDGIYRHLYDLHIGLHD